MVNKQYGWICPKCGTVMAPWMEYCINCISDNYKITCTSSHNNLNAILNDIKKNIDF